MTFSSEDKIAIHEGFTLHNFKGDYGKTYTISNCFFDEIHGVEFIEFFDGVVKYCYPSQAFDIVEKKYD